MGEGRGVRVRVRGWVEPEATGSTGIGLFNMYCTVPVLGPVLVQYLCPYTAELQIPVQVRQL